MMEEQKEILKYGFDDALDHTGFGKYNVLVLSSSCLLILAMYLDIFGFSVVLPAAACDLNLSTGEQGLLSAIPLIGVMLSSYAWGLCADTLGRRATLLGAMPVGAILNLASSIAPGFASLAAIKFFSAAFTSSANAAAFVLVGESTPRRHRSRFMFLMASATMFVQFIICVFALPIFKLTFRIEVEWLNLEFRPWRLLMLIISLPGVLGIIMMIFVKESPKFLISKNRDEDAINVLKTIHRWNGKKEDFPITAVYLEELPVMTNTDASILRKMWDQTAPLFKPPLLKNSLKLYYILLTAYMTSTGFTMWVPTTTNAYFDGEDRAGQTFCQVASTAATSNDTTSENCDNVIQPLTLYAVMCYSGGAGVLTILLSFIVPIMGKKRTTLLIFVVSSISGFILLFVKVHLLSIALFYVFLYVSFILGNVNTYLVELNPTYLRGMATCLSVVVARGFGFISVQVIGAVLGDYCIPMMSGFVALVVSGLLVSLTLPPDPKRIPAELQNKQQNVKSAEGA